MVPRLPVGILLAFLLGAAHLPAFQGPATITNDDVVKMVQAKLAITIILSTIESAHPKFDLTPAGLIALKAAGVEDEIISAMQARARAVKGEPVVTARTSPSTPEKSELLADSKDPEFILRNFKTLCVNAHATYFGSDQMKAALGRNKDFAALRVTIVDDPGVADVVLDVGYTFAWDYPFTLKHQNTSMVLLSGKGSGPFSGPAGASSVASELVKGLKPYRIAAPAPKK